MNLQNLKQYIELYHFGGIADFFVDETPPKKTLPKKSYNAADKDFQHLIEKYADCKSCRYHESNKRIIHGQGVKNATVMMIGLPPSHDEIKNGKPFKFIGDRRETFLKILKAIELDINDFYATNIIKCRTTDYEAIEVSKCLPYLNDQLDIVKPKIILIFGFFVANIIFKKNENVEYYRLHQGQSYKGVPVYITYNPEEMIKNESLKRPAWQDLQKFKEKYLELKVMI